MHAPPLTLSPAQLDALAAWAQLTLYRVRAERATARKKPAPGPSQPAHTCARPRSYHPGRPGHHREPTGLG